MPTKKKDSHQYYQEAMEHGARMIACLATAGMMDLDILPDASAPGAFGIKDAAQYLGISETSFREMLDHGEAPNGYMLGGRRKWNRETLDKLRFKLERKPPK